MKEEIVGAGVELFLEKGFNAAGVKDITDRAGVPKGSFYNHFESKEALGEVALARYGELLRIGLLADRSIPPLERIRRHFEFLRGRLAEFTRGCMYGNFGAEVADHSEVLRRGVQGGLATWSTELAAAITEAQEAGEIRTSLNPELTARFLANAWEGAILRARADKTGDAFADFFAVAFDTLLT